ncbi:MAG: hypothetical protein JNK85_14580 [Verrucomicrobiales bacterium]|nr:hypothetical protein [Verrucomicrobiales bacterium]
MTTRAWISSGLWVIALLAGWAWYTQARNLDAIRLEAGGLEKGIQAPGRGTAMADGETMVVISEPAPTSVERLELMRLRNRVTELRERLREREKVSNQLQQLQTQVEALSRYSNGQFPAGFRRRQDARAMGGATPDAALETFLWALEHQDTNTFLQSIEPGHRRQLEAHLANGGSGDFFKEAKVFPGFLVIGRTNLAPDLVELKIEIGSGGALPMKFHLVDGAWRLSF